MVVLLHNLGQGGVLDWTASSRHSLVYLTIENYAIIAVNVFSLISGYLSVGRKVKPRRLVDLWAAAVFWSVMTALVGVALGVPAGSWVIECAFPVCNVKYWYLDAFLGMQLFLPFVNAGIEKMGGKGTGLIAAGLLATFSLLGFAGGLGTAGGYSTIWLLVMWITGAAIRLNYREVLRAVQTWRLLLGVVVIPVVSTFLEWRSASLGLDASKWIHYVSPLVVIQAICFFLLCLRIDIKGERLRKVIEAVSSAAFGVYLIDNSTWVYGTWLLGRFSWIPGMRVVGGVGLVLLASAAMFVTFLLLEMMRLRLKGAAKQSFERAAGKGAGELR